MHWAAVGRRSWPLLGIVVVLRWLPRPTRQPTARAGCTRRGGELAGTRRRSRRQRMTDRQFRAADAPRPPGRPRSVRADEAIIDAVLDLLAEGTTVEALTIEAVAARAGVGKATIYRRWPTRTRCWWTRCAAQGAAAGAGGAVGPRRPALCRRGRAQRPTTRAAQIMPCLVPELNRSPDLYELYQSIIEPRRELMREVLRRGIGQRRAAGRPRHRGGHGAAGRADAGPAVLRWHPELDTGKLPEQIVDAGVWPGCCPAEASRSGCFAAVPARVGVSAPPRVGADQ